MTPEKQIRAVYDDESIRVYQAFTEQIARRAVQRGTFVEPFSRSRMTWIKPSFLWMMYRSGWAQKDPGQARVLAIDITREGLHWALRHACLAKELQAHDVPPPVRVQWDPERSLGLERLEYRSIQIGLSGEAVHRYVDEWILRIEDITDRVREIHALVSAGDMSSASACLPEERPYPTPEDIVERLF